MVFSSLKARSGCDRKRQVRDRRGEGTGALCTLNGEYLGIYFILNVYA